MALLKEFRRAGHHTALAVSDALPQEIFPPGVPRYSKGAESFPVDPPTRGPAREQWWGEQNRRMAWVSYRDTARIIGEFQPDLIVRDFAERGALLAAESAGVRHATMLTDSTTALERQLTREGALMAPLRTALGLTEDLDGACQVPLMGVSLMHPDFYGTNARLIPNARFFRPPAPRKPAVPAERAGHVPRILITMGTTATVPHLDFLSVALSGLRGSGAEVVVAAPDEIAGQLASRFSYATILGFVPLEPLMDGADLVVGHGGFATMTAALSRGIPLHLTPFHSDQFFNAERALSCGFGTALRWEDCSSANLAESLLTTVHSTTIRTAAREFARRMQTLPALAQCAELLTEPLRGAEIL
ncbi:glycosyltransferase [Streptomyces sp. NPDC127117]|uniref:glycosyltransferase n=1 Tax=Streptomyces sp. NPDC127117 TaxID=3345368 RepID=UPI003634081F